MQIRTINPYKKLPRLLNVCAYARVSTPKEAMLNSLNNQVDHYKSFILKNNKWNYVGVYADYAVTGTKSSREEFQKMLDECRKGNIDLIITKSISRFARNTLDLLNVTRELKSLNVDIYFEAQNLNLLSSQGEFVLTLLADFAQEESRSASDNLKWRIRKGFENGYAWNQSITGYKFINGSFEIIPDEAEIVKKIYSLYLDGLGLPAIAKELDKSGAISKRNTEHWNINSIRRILTCYTYTGNLLLQTTYKNNNVEKKRMVNKGELNKYHVEDTHESIIPLETWNKVQEEIKRRDSLIKHTSKKEPSLFAGMLTCSHCGKHYTRKVNKYGSYYICPTFSQKGKEYCASKQVREEPLIESTKEVLSLTQLTREVIKDKLIEIVIHDDNVLVFKLRDGSEVNKTWAYRSRSESWTEEMKAKARIDGAKASKKGEKTCQE